MCWPHSQRQVLQALPSAHLPPLRLQLGAQGASPAQLVLQLPRALGVASVALLQLPHLPPQLPQLAQAEPAAVQRGLQLPRAFRGLPGRGGNWGKGTKSAVRVQLGSM